MRNISLCSARMIGALLAAISLFVGCSKDAENCANLSNCVPPDAGNNGGSGAGGNTAAACPSGCSGSTPFCDLAAKKCVACLTSVNCASSAASLCSAGTCESCKQDSDCSHIDGKNVCNAGTCVECTGTKYGTCAGDAGTPTVCDSLQHTCTTKVEHSAALCQPCVSDAECMLGRVCSQQKFGTTNVGYFCFFRQGDTANGAPADCTTSRPYISAIAAVSIDGQSTQICTLAASTCTAMNQYRSTNCASSASIPDNNLCGFSAGVDSECAAFGSSQYRCTIACGSDDDCPLIGASSPTCSLSATAGTRKYCSL